MNRNLNIIVSRVATRMQNFFIKDDEAFECLDSYNLNVQYDIILQTKEEKKKQILVIPMQNVYEFILIIETLIDTHNQVKLDKKFSYYGVSYIDTYLRFVSDMFYMDMVYDGEDPSNSSHIKSIAFTLDDMNDLIADILNARSTISIIDSNQNKEGV